MSKVPRKDFDLNESLNVSVGSEVVSRDVQGCGEGRPCSGGREC